MNLLSPEIAREDIEGGSAICDEAGIPIAGGHSIDSPEPIFGLAVTGIVDNSYLKQNNKAVPGCEIFLTKPLGIGILTTAQKQKKIEPGHIDAAILAMTTLNKIGAEISKLNSVVTLTDITGFGLLGHLGEICESSGISAIIDFEKVPLLPNTKKYLEMNCIPGGTINNYRSYGDNIEVMTEEQRHILCDAQTSGGLLVFVKKEGVSEFLKITADAGLSLQSIGQTVERFGKLIRVR